MKSKKLSLICPRCYSIIGEFETNTIRLFHNSFVDFNYLFIDTKSPKTICGHCGYRYIENKFFAQNFLLSDSRYAEFLTKLFKKGYKFNIDCYLNTLCLSFEDNGIFSLKDLGNIKDLFEIKEFKNISINKQHIEITISDLDDEENRKKFSNWVDSLPYIQMK